MKEEAAKAIERRFRLMTILMGGARPRASELAERFDVTLRTVYRDVAFLEDDLRIPIRREGGRYGIMDTFKVKPVQFQPDEVLALMAALDFGRRNRSLHPKAALTAQEKLRAVLPSKEQEIAAGLDQTLVVDPVPGQSQPAQPGVDERLRAALQGPHPVRIQYQALAAEQPTERVIRPYGLAYRGTALYLIGYCEMRKAIRTFRVNRITAAQPLGETFTRPADFDLEAFLADIWGIEDGPQMEVRLRFYPEVARLAHETVWHPTQENQEEPDGSVIVTMKTRGKNELARWLTGYGATVEVLAPPELRESVLALGRAILARYGDSTRQMEGIHL